MTRLNQDFSLARMTDEIPKHYPEDFSDLHDLILCTSDPEIPKEMLHGTPAIVTRELDGIKYRVFALYYDGDCKGFTVTINTPDGLIDLSVNQYRTHALFMYDRKKETLNTYVLD